MTEKRFKMVKSEFTGKYIPVDNNKFYNFCGFEDKWDCINFVRALNDFSKRAITNGKIASKYLEENEQLKVQLKKGEDVCDIYKYQYLTKTNADEYYIAKCKKEHIECSKDNVKYCEDFECKEITE